MANMASSMPIHCCMFSIPLWSCLTGICWLQHLTLALLTGRTDLCTAGVFGAGKTRAAAAVIVGLIAIDPTLAIMVCTKENAAAQAFAEHVVSMNLPDSLLAKFGRLIGFHEAQKGASARTAIDVSSQNRNHILRGKQVIIGCGLLDVFFLLDAAWVRSRAERPSVSYTKVSAVSLGLAKSCNYTSQNKVKQNSGSNKFLIAGDGKMKRMREP